MSDRIRLRKYKLTLKSWKSDMNLPIPVDKVEGIKVRWLLYTTASAGNLELQLSCDSFEDSGYNLLVGGATTPYFFSTPLDTSADVTCITAAFDGPYDIDFREPIRSINRLSIEATINGSPTNDITELNPLVVELGFYYRD